MNKSIKAIRETSFIKTGKANDTISLFWKAHHISLENKTQDEIQKKEKSIRFTEGFIDLDYIDLCEFRKQII